MLLNGREKVNLWFRMIDYMLLEYLARCDSKAEDSNILRIMAKLNHSVLCKPAFIGSEVDLCNQHLPKSAKYTQHCPAGHVRGYECR